MPYLRCLGIRMAMYVGMAFMMAVIWIRLPKDDGMLPALSPPSSGSHPSSYIVRINDRLSVHFYGVAFLSFMRYVIPPLPPFACPTTTDLS
jgi:hypothetical protein